MVRSSGPAARKLPLFLMAAQQYQERSGVPNYQVDTPYDFYVASEGFRGKSDGLIWKNFGSFSIKGLDCAP